MPVDRSILLPSPPRPGFNISRVYANRGRWIAECQCMSAAQVRPEVKTWCCQECGTGYQLLWPARRVEIEQLLRPRPIDHQNWVVGEPVEHLLEENIEHGLAPEPVAG